MLFDYKKTIMFVSNGYMCLVVKLSFIHLY